MTRLEQKGEERSGTTLAAYMVQQAFGLRNLEGRKLHTHRHDLIKPGQWQGKNIALMINIKDPYAWIVSAHAWDQQAKHDGRKVPASKVAVAFKPENVKHWLDRYMRRYRNWFAAPFPKAVIRYEDILQDTMALYKPISALLGRPPDPAKLWKEMPSTVIRPGRTPKGQRTLQFDLTYYTDKKYFDLLSTEHIKQITDDADWELLDGLYEPV